MQFYIFILKFNLPDRSNKRRINQQSKKSAKLAKISKTLHHNNNIPPSLKHIIRKDNKLINMNTLPENLSFGLTL